LGAVVAGAAVGGWALDRHYSAPTPGPFIVLADESETMRTFREELRRKYGEKVYSFHDEEILIRDYFQDERAGYFVDVGASHFERLSNTYYLEKNLGWKGIGIDAQEKYEPDYRRFRPNTKYLVYFVGDRESSGKQVDFFVDLESEFASSGIDGSVTHPSKKISVPSITLDELLEREGVTAVDFVTMDIEDSEPGALAGFSIRRWRPRLVCVEMHLRVKQQILTYFKNNGYVRLRSYENIDWLNGYFVPEDSPGARREADRSRSLAQALDRETEEKALAAKRGKR
jgi:FkbM family methyltransferase